MWDELCFWNISALECCGWKTHETQMNSSRLFAYAIVRQVANCCQKQAGWDRMVKGTQGKCYLEDGSLLS